MEKNRKEEWKKGNYFMGHFLFPAVAPALGRVPASLSGCAGGPEGTCPLHHSCPSQMALLFLFHNPSRCVLNRNIKFSWPLDGGLLAMRCLLASGCVATVQKVLNTTFLLYSQSVGKLLVKICYVLCEIVFRTEPLIYELFWVTCWIEDKWAEVYISLGGRKHSLWGTDFHYSCLGRICHYFYVTYIYHFAGYLVENAEYRKMAFPTHNICTPGLTIHS